MRSRPLCLFLCLAILLPSTAAVAEQRWTEVRSPHFRVLTDGSASDARHVAREFEQMRYVFATLFPTFRLKSGAPLVIFAASDRNTAKALEPRVWKMKGEKPAGIFHHGWEKQYVMVRLDVTGPWARATVLHEYTHSILHLNAHWLPIWLDEGLADFYGNTQFKGGKIYVGAPSLRIQSLHAEPIPVETLISVTPASPYYHEADKVYRFYADSWALVHYLTFGPNMGTGAKLGQFFNLIQNGTPQKQAFQQVFGSFASVDKGLDRYMRSFLFNALVLPNPPQINEKTFTTRKLTPAETYAELAGYHLWTHDLLHAQPLVDKALKADPNLGFAHEEQGFLLFSNGKDTAAANEFSQAYKLDPTLYLSLFAKTMLSPAASLKTAADQAAFNSAMLKITAIHPLFAPAFVQLARLSLRQGDLQRAFGVSRRAEELEPWRAGYHLLSGQILLRMEKDSEAADFAQYVAKHWSGPDHDEAVELWDKTPVADRPAGVTLTDEVPPNTLTSTGIVQSVQCPTPSTDNHAKPQGPPPTLTIVSDAKPLTFQMNKVAMFGFSDTLWWGEDHFSPCHNLQGLRAIVRYRPATATGYAGSIVELSVLDTLPKPDAASPKQAAAAETR